MSKRQRTASGSSSAASASAASGTGDEAPAAKILRLEGEVRALREREGALVMKLSMQEGEVHTLKSCIQDLYKTKSRAEGSLRKTLLDPTINMEVKLLKDQLREANDKLDTNQAELEAVKFDPKSNTGRKLVNKCKTLVRENEELGKQVSEGNIQQLRVERDLQKSEVVRLRKDLEEALMYNEDMDEERCVRGAVPLGACTGVRAGGERGRLDRGRRSTGARGGESEVWRWKVWPAPMIGVRVYPTQAVHMRTPTHAKHTWTTPPLPHPACVCRASCAVFEPVRSLAMM